MFTKTLNIVVKICIVIGMLIGAALVVLLFVNILPSARESFALNGKPESFYYFSGALAMLCVAGAEYIAWTLLSMMRSVDSDPFVHKNVRALRCMGFTAVGISICGLLTLFLHPVPLAVVAALPIGMCGLFSLVLAQVFDRAVRIKQENDLTV